MNVRIKLFFRDPLSSDGYAVLEGEVAGELRWESDASSYKSVSELPLSLLYEVEICDDERLVTVDVYEVDMEEAAEVDDGS